MKTDKLNVIHPTGLAYRLKLIRGERGLTQEQLAERAGISQSAIGNIESGHRKRPRDLVAIATALGVTPEWLETGHSGLVAPEQTFEKRACAPEPQSIRLAMELLGRLAIKQRPTLRKNLGNLLVELVEHPDDPDVIEQTITDIERFFGPAT